MSSELFSRYAVALIDLAEESKSLKKIDQDFSELYAMLEASADLRSFISSPQVSKMEQINTIEALVKKAKFQKLTANFLGVLVENGRLNILPQIIEAFYKELSNRRGEKVAQVQVVQDLTAKQKKDLEAGLSEAIGADVALDVQINPDILGGMVLTVGSTMIDDSVARKLERLKSNMTSTVAA